MNRPPKKIIAWMVLAAALGIIALVGSKDYENPGKSPTKASAEGLSPEMAPEHTGKPGSHASSLERLSAQLGAPVPALDRIFVIMRDKKTPLELLDQVLNRIVSEFLELKKELAQDAGDADAPPGENEAVITALDAGDFQEVERLLRQEAEALPPPPDAAPASPPDAAQQAPSPGYRRAVLATARLGRLKNITMDYGEAAQYFEKAAHMAGKGFPKTQAQCLNLQGAALFLAGDAQGSGKAFTQAVQASKQAFGPEHPLYVQALNNLANAHRAQGGFREAEPLYSQALEIRQKVLGPEDPSVAAAMNNLAGVYQNMGKYETARTLYEQSLQIKEKVLGPEDPSMAPTLNNLASLLQLMGNGAEAQKLYERSISITQKTLGPNHPGVASALNNLARLHQSQEEYDDARELFLAALAITENTLGPNHPNTAAILINLAELDFVQDRPAQAEALCRKALGILEKAVGPDHPDVIRTRKLLAQAAARGPGLEPWAP